MKKRKTRRAEVPIEYRKPRFAALKENVLRFLICLLTIAFFSILPFLR